MNKKHTINIILLICFFGLSGKLFSQEKLTLQSILQNTLFQSQQSKIPFFIKKFNNFPTQKTEHLLEQVSSYHNSNLSIDFSPNFWKSLKNEPSFFPLKMYVKAQKFYADFSIDNIKAGAQILNIQGVKLEQLYSFFKKWVPHDSVSIGHYEHMLSQNFFLYYWIYFGKSKGWEVKYLDFDKQIKSAYVKAEDLVTTKENYKKGYSARSLKFAGLGNEKKIYFANFESDSISILRVNNLDIPEQDFIGFIVYYLNALRENSIKKIVLDLRQNQSIAYKNAELLANFFTDGRYRYSLDFEAQGVEIPYKDKVVAVNGTKEFDLSIIENTLNKNFKKSEDGHYRKSDIQDELFFVKKSSKNKKNKIDPNLTPDLQTPDKRNFKGKVYIWANEGTRNAGALAVELIKRGNHKAKWIGTKLGSSVRSQWGQIILSYKLDENFILNVPWIYNKIKPQLKVEPEPDDFLEFDPIAFRLRKDIYWSYFQKKYLGRKNSGHNFIKK